MLRNYPVGKVSLRENKVLVASSSTPTPKGAPSSFGTRRNHLCALTTQQKSKASPDVMTGTLKLFSLDVYYLLNLVSFLSYVIPFMALHFGFGPKCVSNLFSISTSVGNSIIARRVYKGV